MTLQRIPSWLINDLPSTPSNPSDGTPLSTRPILIVASGQSNMVGWTFANNGPLPLRADVSIWSREEQDFVLANLAGPAIPIYTGNPSQAVKSVCGGRNNLAIAFGHRVALETGRPVRIVFNATGGRNLSFWIADGTDSVDYQALQTDVGGALDALGLSRVDFFLWQHGESNAQADKTAGAYVAGMQQFLAQLRGESWWDADTQFIGGYPPPQWSDAVSLAYLNSEIDALVALGMRDVAYARSDRLAYSSGDTIHFAGRSLYGLGYSRYWDAVKRKPLSVTGGSKIENGEIPDIYAGTSTTAPVAYGSAVGPIFTRTIAPRATRLYVLAPSIAKTGTRLWSGFTANAQQAGEGPGDFGCVKYCDDDGDTWVEYGHFIMPDANDHCLEPNFWVDPSGALWVFITVSRSLTTVFDGSFGTWAAICRNPRAAVPQFSRPFQVAKFGLCQKPFLLGGKYYVSVDLWRDPAGQPFLASESGKWLYELDWANGKAKRSILLPENAFTSFDEKNAWQMANGNWRACFRTSAPGQYITESDDGGLTWSTPEPWAALGTNANSRARVFETSAGRLGILYNNAADRTNFRLKLSDDGGDSFPWTKVLTNLTTDQKSYPDVCVSGDTIYAVSDDAIPGRGTTRRITLYKTTESSVVAAAATVTRSFIE